LLVVGWSSVCACRRRVVYVVYVVHVIVCVVLLAPHKDLESGHGEAKAGGRSSNNVGKKVESTALLDAAFGDGSSSDSEDEATGDDLEIARLRASASVSERADSGRARLCWFAS
jgi:hypothetical protein